MNSERLRTSAKSWKLNRRERKETQRSQLRTEPRASVRKSWKKMVLLVSAGSVSRRDSQRSSRTPDHQEKKVLDSCPDQLWARRHQRKKRKEEALKKIRVDPLSPRLGKTMMTRLASCLDLPWEHKRPMLH